MRNFLKSLGGSILRSTRNTQRRRSPRLLGGEPLELRTMMAGDFLATVRMEATNLSGTPITKADVGQQIQLRAYVKDEVAGTGSGGVFSAYLDVGYPASIVSAIAGSIVHPSPFTSSTSGSTPAGGPLTNVGGISLSAQTPGNLERLLFTANFTTTALGAANFVPTLTSNASFEFTLRELPGTPLIASQIDFKPFTLDVVQFDALNDQFDIAQGSSNQPLNVLLNDTLSAAGGTLTITQVGPRSNGGSVSIVNGTSLLYTAGAGSTGTDTFTYTISDGLGHTDQAQVTITLVASASSSLGDRVWQDLDADGLQDAGEPGVANVLVRLMQPGADGKIGGTDDTFVTSDITDSNGAYELNSLFPGTYYLIFSSLPAGTVFTTPNVGADDALDSDVTPDTGRTGIFTLGLNTDDTTRDAGIVTAPATIPGQFHLSLVLNPSTVDASGQTQTLPTNEPWIDEWRSFWVEVWVSTPQTTTIGVIAAAMQLGYNSTYFTAVEVQPGTAFAGQLTSNINDTNGTVALSGTQSTAGTVGADQFVQLARIRFQPTSADTGVPLTLGPDLRILPAEDTWIQMIAGAGESITLTGNVAATVSVAAVPSTSLWPVMYDLDDITDAGGQEIGFGDFAIFASKFFQTVGTTPSAAIADFDLSGRVDFGDFSLFASNFLRVRGSGGPLSYPANFPAAWESLLQLEGGAAASSTLAAPLEAADLSIVIDAAVARIDQALGSTVGPELANVRYEIRDLPGTTLGQVVGQTVQIDVNAAGWGWFVDATPWADEEFSFDTGTHELTADATSAAHDRVDLLSVIMHELAHVLGYEHADSGLMRATMPTGTRRSLSNDLLDHVAVAGEVALLDEVYTALGS